MKKYIDISGFDLRDTNRGTAALGYGSIPFLESKGYLREGQELIFFHRYKKFWKSSNTKVLHEDLRINGKTYKRTIVPIHDIEYRLVQKLGIVLPFTKFGKYVKQVELEAAINGGDGFSDTHLHEPHEPDMDSPQGWSTPNVFTSNHWSFQRQ